MSLIRRVAGRRAVALRPSIQQAGRDLVLVRPQKDEVCPYTLARGWHKALRGLPVPTPWLRVVEHWIETERDRQLSAGTAWHWDINRFRGQEPSSTTLYAAVADFHDYLNGWEGDEGNAVRALLADVREHVPGATWDSEEHWPNFMGSGWRVGWEAWCSICTGSAHWKAVHPASRKRIESLQPHNAPQQFLRAAIAEQRARDRRDPEGIPNARVWVPACGIESSTDYALATFSFWGRP